MSKFITDGDKEKIFKVIKPGKKKKEKPTAMQKAASDNYKK